MNFNPEHNCHDWHLPVIMGAVGALVAFGICWGCCRLRKKRAPTELDIKFLHDDDEEFTNVANSGKNYDII